MTFSTKGVVTIGTTHNVPPALYNSWTTSEQVSWVSGQALLGYKINITNIELPNLHKIEDLLQMQHKLKNDFSKTLASYFNITDTTVTDDVNNTLKAVQCALFRLRSEILKASGYTLAAVPDTFDVCKEFVLTNKRIHRTEDSNPLHSLSSSEFKDLFINCFERLWKSRDGRPLNYRLTKVNPDGATGRYTAEITLDDVSVGCQRIERYEMEAIALQLGFTGTVFPD